MRAVPASTLRASVRVDSWVRTAPMTGSRMCRRSAPSPNAPVVNRQLRRLRRFEWNRGIRARPALRLPSAAARFAHPDAYASFEFSTHHGATSCLTAFHAIRSP